MVLLQEMEKAAKTIIKGERAQAISFVFKKV
jgi:hypothetical protein